MKGNNFIRCLFYCFFKEGNKLAKDYHIDIEPLKSSFHIKGLEHTDWGMKYRLSRNFNPKTEKTVMLAFDHGYIMGSTAGLERLDIVVPQLAQEVDVFMATRGAIRTCIVEIHLQIKFEIWGG